VTQGVGPEFKPQNHKKKKKKKRKKWEMARQEWLTLLERLRFRAPQS
jgi:hypothetical protein